MLGWRIGGNGQDVGLETGNIGLHNVQLDYCDMGQ